MILVLRLTAVASLILFAYAMYKLATRPRTTYFTDKFRIPPGATIEVYVNGNKMQRGTDYVECDGIIIFEGV